MKKFIVEQRVFEAGHYYWENYEIGDDGFAYGEDEEQANWAVEDWFEEHGFEIPEYRLIPAE